MIYRDPKTSHMTLTTPIWMFCHSKDNPCYGLYLCTKFEKTASSISKDTKEDRKRKIAVIWGEWAHPRSLELSPFDRPTAHIYLSYSPFVEKCLSILYRFWHTDLFVESRKFFVRHVHFGPPLKFHQDVRCLKTNAHGLPCCVVCLMTFYLTDRNRAIAYTALAQRRAVKMQINTATLVFKLRKCVPIMTNYYGRPM